MSKKSEIPTIEKKEMKIVVEVNESGLSIDLGTYSPIQGIGMLEIAKNLIVKKLNEEE